MNYEDVRVGQQVKYMRFRNNKPVQVATGQITGFNGPSRRVYFNSGAGGLERETLMDPAPLSIWREAPIRTEWLP